MTNERNAFRILTPVLSALLGAAVPVLAGDTWDGGFGSADAACRSKYDDSGAFRYSRAEVKGNVAHCYSIAKEDGKDEYYDTAVTKDEPAEEAKEEAKEEKKDSGGGAGKTGGPSSPPAGSSADAFPHKCIEAYGTTNFEAELDAAHKAFPVVGGNVAVLEWKDKGKKKTKWFSSQGAHSEQNILSFMAANNIPKESVTRIFTELSPCVTQCLPVLSQHFEGVRKNVTIEFHWVHDTELGYKTCGKKGKMENAVQIRQDRKQERIERVMKK